MLPQLPANPAPPQPDIIPPAPLPLDRPKLPELPEAK
jgi:hypothetical protein